MLTSNSNLPEDVMVEILSRLPVKPLMRFKSVCKSWHSLVKHPIFISKHIKNYTDDNTCIVVNYLDAATDQPIYILFPDETLEDISFQDLTSRVPILGQLLGPYDGLFFLYAKETNRIFLWNIATRESRILPRCGTVLPRYTETCFCIIGFGLDPISNEYKLVFMRSLWDDESHFFYLFSHVTLYTLKSNSWRDFRAVELTNYYVLNKNSDSTYLNGICYWLALSNEDDHQVILSFHMGNEIYEEIKGPCIPYAARTILGLCNDSLALLILDRNENDIDIWVRKEMSWTKQLSIGPLLRIREPRGFWKNGKFFIESDTGQLLLYDTCSQELRDLQLRAVWIEVHNYKESLVTVNPDDSLSGFIEIPWHILGVYQTDTNLN